MAAWARQFVSQKKKRWVNAEENIDLDLSYITDRIIAMGFPSEGAAGLYRNPMPMVLKFMKLQHGLDNVKVYNLCSERAYATGAFPHALRVPFDDHNPAADAADAVGATTALAHFAASRTEDGKGVTIPSQIRWVHYWDLRTGAYRRPAPAIVEI
ncbi:phosphatase [Aureococcus anophagefferens]|nr:phosphatase [Aureococcus anophagefferens]